MEGKGGQETVENKMNTEKEVKTQQVKGIAVCFSFLLLTNKE